MRVVELYISLNSRGIAKAKSCQLLLAQHRLITDMSRALFCAHTLNTFIRLMINQAKEQFS